VEQRHDKKTSKHCAHLRSVISDLSTNTLGQFQRHDNVKLALYDDIQNDSHNDKSR
jgi:hypothetical protein